MSHPVYLTHAARADLEEPYQYIAEHDAPEKAEHVLDKLTEQFSRLAELPDRGAITRELRTLGIKEYREVYFKPYRIIYRVMNSAVYVYCIVDGRRDMQSLLLQRVLR